jgi:hypothetical protein
MRRLSRHTRALVPTLTRIGLPTLLVLGLADPAQAHIKWFAPFVVADQPRVLDRVFNLDFLALCTLAVFILVIGCVLDRTWIGEALLRALDRVTAGFRDNAGTVLRAVVAFFCIALWMMGGTLLTPELKTQADWVPLLQLAMAASLVSRRTSIVAGVGIIFLFVVAEYQYGLFHLMDYPIFLGVAVYLIDYALPGPTRLKIRPLDVLRYSAAVTLMWASIEKWAYPGWTLPIYISHPAMSMGYGFELFMRAAGVIEFTLAFALLWTPLVRRVAAFILLGMFVAATFEFGKLDVIGHSVIVAVLLLLASDNRRARPEPRAWRWVATPALAYVAALLTFLSAYYGLHRLLFGTTII